MPELLRAVLAAVSLLAGLLVVAGTAFADPASDPDTEVARRHFRAGTELYETGRYQDAIEEFELADEARALPELSYNIARCYDRLGQWAEAARQYQRYVSGAPDAADAAEVRARIRVLKARAQRRRAATGEDEAEALPSHAVKEGKPAKANVAPQVREAEPGNVESAEPSGEERRERASSGASGEQHGGARAAAWAVGALALAAAGVGAGLVGSAASDYNQLRSDCAARPCTQADWSGAELRANVGYAMFGVAGAAAVVDVVLWIVQGRRARPAESAARFLIAPAANGVVAGGSF